MNIFYLSHDPVEIAFWLVDKHVVKMPLESCQMLSTVHRLVDGEPVEIETAAGRQKVLYLLEGEKLERDEVGWNIKGRRCYLPTHVNHPSTKWTMSSLENYEFHARLLLAMLNEYRQRYGQRHESIMAMLPFLLYPPRRLHRVAFAPPPPVMPRCYKVENNSVESYRNFYAGSKWRFAKWKHGYVPRWFVPRVIEMWPRGDQAERALALEVALKKKTPPAAPEVMRALSTLQ